MLDCEVEGISLDGDWTMLDVEGISLTDGTALGPVKWSEVGGINDFVGTLHLALQDSADVADWKESHYGSGPVRLHSGFWNEIISRCDEIKAIANNETKSWVNPAKWNVYWLQMIYTYMFDLNHAIFFLWHSLVFFKYNVTRWNPMRSVRLTTSIY